VLSTRTKISLAQFLTLQTDDSLALLCEKHGVAAPNFAYAYDRQQAVRAWVDQTSQATVLSVLDEIVRTHSTIRYSVSPKYRFDERWDDLVRCLQLDGYLVDLAARVIRPIDPAIAGADHRVIRQIRRGVSSVST
jgi:hypothetical protein